MRESANLACYAIVYAKGMVPKDKLDQAMMTSVSEGAPLEQVLVKSNALKPGAVDDLIKARNRLGRHCAKCGEQTFLLQDQNESNTKCEDEKCGGKLLTTAEWAARQKPLPNLRPAGATPVHGVKVGDGGAAFEGRIAKLEAALKALEERAGKPDPGALARAAEHAEKVLAPRLDAARKEAAMAIREAAAAKEASEKASQAGQGLAERAVASVAEGLGVSDLADLPGHLAEQLTPRVMQAVRGRLEEVSGLGDRVAALEAGAGERGGGAGVDPMVVAAQVTSQVAAQVTDSLEGRLADLEKRLAATDGLAERVTAGLKKVPDAAKLADDVTAKVKAALPPPLDADELVERATRAVLSSVDRTLDERLAEKPGASDATRDAAKEIAREAAKETVRPLEARLAELEARGGTGALEERLAEIEARADREELALGKRLAQLEEDQAQAAPAPAGIDDAALEAKLGEVEQRIGAAQADVLEALNGRVEELAKALDGLPAKASKDAVAAVKDRIEQLDDPRELMGRAATQATKDALAAVEKRLAQLGQAGPAPAAAAGGAAKADLDKLQAGLDELKETIELLQARMDAQRARQGPSPDELVARVQEGVLATVGERMVALEARLAETSGAAARSTTSDASTPGEGGAVNADAVVQQAVQAVWDQLDPLDLPGLPQRMTELVTKSVLAQIDENLAGLPDRLAASAAAPVMASIEARLAKLDLKNLPKKIAADVKAELGAGGGGPAVDEEALAARILEQVDQKLAERPAPEGNGGGGGVDLDQVREVAREVAAELVAESQAQGGAPAPSGNGNGDGDEGGAGDGGKTEKRLAAMARALKELKDDFDGVKEQVGTLADRPPVGEAAPAAGPVPRELIAFLNSTEFKEVFDKRINEVLRYVKNDLVPGAVKKAVDAASAAGSS